MNCAAITVDKNGKPITKESSYSQFCIGLIQSTNKGCERCAASHNRMGQEAAKTNKPFVGTCHAGLIDFSAPIKVEGKLIGTVLGGQILDSAADIAHLRRTASEIGVNAYFALFSCAFFIISLFFSNPVPRYNDIPNSFISNPPIT